LAKCYSNTNTKYLLLIAVFSVLQLGDKYHGVNPLFHWPHELLKTPKINYSADSSIFGFKYRLFIYYFSSHWLSRLPDSQGGLLKIAALSSWVSLSELPTFSIK